MATQATSLSARGTELFAHGGHLDKFREIWGNAYNPESNPDGFVNMGTSENVNLSFLYSNKHQE